MASEANLTPVCVFLYFSLSPLDQRQTWGFYGMMAVSLRPLMTQSLPRLPHTPWLEPQCYPQGCPTLSPLSPSPLLSDLDAIKGSEEAQVTVGPFVPGAGLFVKPGAVGLQEGCQEFVERVQ